MDSVASIDGTEIPADGRATERIMKFLDKKWGTTPLQMDKAPRMYVQDVWNDTAINSIPQSAEKSQYFVRESLSNSAKAAFDIAMEGATDPEATARQFEIKYREGELGYAFEVDEDSELTPSMQEAAYKYGAEAAKAQKEITSKSYNNKAGTVFVEEGVSIPKSLNTPNKKLLVFRVYEVVKNKRKKQHFAREKRLFHRAPCCFLFFERLVFLRHKALCGKGKSGRTYNMPSTCFEKGVMNLCNAPS